MIDCFKDFLFHYNALRAPRNQLNGNAAPRDGLGKKSLMGFVQPAMTHLDRRRQGRGNLALFSSMHPQSTVRFVPAFGLRLSGLGYFVGIGPQAKNGGVYSRNAVGRPVQDNARNLRL